MALTAALGTAPTANRNNFSGSVGYQFSAGSDLTITALGRVVGSTFASSHKVILWSDTGTNLGEVTITTSSPTLNGWAYEMLPSPVSLTHNTRYRIGVTETSGGDNWKDTSILTDYDTSFIGQPYTAYSTTQDAFPNISGGVAPYAFAWPNMYEGSVDGGANSRHYNQQQAAAL